MPGASPVDRDVGFTPTVNRVWGRIEWLMTVSQILPFSTSAVVVARSTARFPSAPF